MSRAIVLIVLACFWAACWAWPTGAPDTTCSSMTPSHGHDNTISLSSSYTIMTSKSQYSPGDKITVTISGNAAAKFRGFLVQVRQGTTAVGTMTITANGKNVCGQAVVTHKSNDDKASISIEWTAPFSSAGDVQVWATIVQTQPVWTTIKGPIIKHAPGSSTTTTTTTKSTATTKGTSTPVSTSRLSTAMPTTTTTMAAVPSACRNAKSCFVRNLTCTTDCDFLLTWETVGSEVKFEMSGITDGYVAVGFSNDKMMGDDNVVMCTNMGEVTNRYTPGHIEPEAIDENNRRIGLTSSSVTAKGMGRVTCSFSRQKTFVVSAQNPPSKNVNVTQVFDLKNSYYLLLARGDIDSTGEPEMHNRRPSISMKKIDFSQNLLVVDDYPPIFVGAAGLRVNTELIFRNSIFGLRSQIVMFSLLIMKMLH